MGCNCQSAGSAPAIASDPCRRVNYTLGMILGVDDFIQEQVYTNAHREALSRLAVGYGTLKGLFVDLPPYASADKASVVVGAGTALVPSGRLVHVDSDQTCQLVGWLDAHPVDAKIVKSHPGDPDRPGSWAKAWVVLSYREALCADVPIPGEACRTDDKLMAPSRVEDSWALDIRWERPAQTEEDALGDYFEWACKIPWSEVVKGPTEKDLFQAFRDAAENRLESGWEGDLQADPAEYQKGAPDGKWRLEGELFRAILRLWATEFRSRWCLRYGWAPASTDADSLLLSGVWIPVAKDGTGAWKFDESDKRIASLDQSRRPVLQSLRALQEIVLRLPSQLMASMGELSGDAKGPISANKVVALQGKAVSDAAPKNGQILTCMGGVWTPQDPTPAPVVPPQAPFVGRAGGAYDIVAAGTVTIGPPTLRGLGKLVLSEAYASKVALEAGSSPDLVRIAIETRGRVATGSVRFVQFTKIWLPGSTRAEDAPTLDYEIVLERDGDRLIARVVPRSALASSIAFQYQVFEAQLEGRIVP